MRLNMVLFGVEHHISAQEVRKDCWYSNELDEDG